MAHGVQTILSESMDKRETRVTPAECRIESVAFPSAGGHLMLAEPFHPVATRQYPCAGEEHVGEVCLVSGRTVRQALRSNDHPLDPRFRLPRCAGFSNEFPPSYPEIHIALTTP
jgi:hypothetical protein